MTTTTQQLGGPYRETRHCFMNARVRHRRVDNFSRGHRGPFFSCHFHIRAPLWPGLIWRSGRVHSPVGASGPATGTVEPSIVPCLSVADGSQLSDQFVLTSHPPIRCDHFVATARRILPIDALRLLGLPGRVL